MTTTTTRSSRSRRPLTDAEKEQRVKDAHDRIAAGVKQIQTSEDWQRWLRTGARFHRYSFNNIMLILSQCPDATRVASSSTWHKMNRWTLRGSKAIWIFAPILVKYTREEIAEDPRREGQSHLIGFKTVPVFDISQTDGEPLPTNPINERPELLEGDAPDKAQQIADLLCDLGYSIEAGDPGINGAHGITDMVNHRIIIREGLGDAHTFKTVMHELAHANLHDPRVAPEGLTRSVAEVEAESVAFIVCEYFGVKSDAYSFEYVTGWAGRDVDAVMSTGARVMTCAKHIINALEK